MEGKHRIIPAFAQIALGPMALHVPPSVTINGVVSSIILLVHLSISVQNSVTMTNRFYQLILWAMAFNFVGVIRTVATTFLSRIVAKLQPLFSR